MPNAASSRSARGLLNIDEQKLVPTFHARPGHDGGKYESREQLPSLDRLLEHSLRAIAYNHDTRDRSGRTFDALWKKVCRNLKRYKNAASYERWKQADIIRNAAERKDLEEKVAVAWAQIYSPAIEDQGSQGKRTEEYKRLKQELDDFSANSKVQIDDILEVAIAYWIEAMNARGADEESRALHALIECWTYIGMTLSPKMDSEAQSDNAGQRGKEAREKIADIATSILIEMKVDVRMADPDYLFGLVAMRIENDPSHAEDLKAYDEQASKGKKTINSLSDRLTKTLKDWATAGREGYPKLAAAYRSAIGRAERLQPPNRRDRRMSTQ